MQNIKDDKNKQQGEESSGTTLQLLTATTYEARRVRSVLKNHQNIQVLVTGMGPCAVDRFLKTHWKKSCPVGIIGFCGGLDQSVKVGDLAVGGSGSQALISVLLASGMRVHAESLTSVDQIIGTVHQKTELFKKTGALCVDMETQYLISQNQSADWFYLKVVVDDSESSLEFLAERFHRHGVLTTKDFEDWKKNDPMGFESNLKNQKQAEQKLESALKVVVENTFRQFHQRGLG